MTEFETKKCCHGNQIGSCNICGDPRFNTVSHNITNAFIIEEEKWPEDKLNLLQTVCDGIEGATVEFFTYDPTPNDPQNRKRYGRITYIENGRRVDNSKVWKEFYKYK